MEDTTHQRRRAAGVGAGKSIARDEQGGSHCEVSTDVEEGVRKKEGAQSHETLKKRSSKPPREKEASLGKEEVAVAARVGWPRIAKLTLYLCPEILRPLTTMRLGQLARKLGTSTSDIVQFLATKNIPIEDGINTRVEDMLVSAVVEKFAPERLAEFTQAANVHEVEPEPPVEEVQPELTETVQAEEAPVIEAATEVPNEEPAKIEVIKAPKVELSGLKVLGKIDLPEPKKKEEPKVEGEEATQPGSEAPARTGRPPRGPREQRRQRESRREPRQNSIAAQREREAEEAKRKREEQLKREKERKTQHYLKNVKVAAPTKASKILREQVEELEPIEDQPKTWWGKLKRWFTT